MRCISSPAGGTVSYEEYGDGPPLVLVHGAFSDHRTNWELVQPLLAQRFTVLLGHSYGAHAALAAAVLAPARARKLVLYEPPRPSVVESDAIRALEELAQAGDWAGFAVKFFRDLLLVPKAELDELRTTALGDAIVADARASLGDLRALVRHDFRAERLRALSLPVPLQIGTASPPGLYVTDALAAVLPDVRIDELPGQAHEAMATAPSMYAESVLRFLCA